MLKRTTLKRIQKKKKRRRDYERKQNVNHNLPAFAKQLIQGDNIDTVKKMGIECYDLPIGGLTHIPFYRSRL